MELKELEVITKDEYRKYKTEKSRFIENILVTAREEESSCIKTI